MSGRAAGNVRKYACPTCGGTEFLAVIHIGLDNNDRADEAIEDGYVCRKCQTHIAISDDREITAVVPEQNESAQPTSRILGHRVRSSVSADERMQSIPRDRREPRL